MAAGADQPILAALRQQAAQEQFSLHIPGHQSGRLLPADLAVWLGQAARLDLTELPGLDNLQHPRGVIEQSQQLAAAAYGSQACLYSVHGSSICVMAALVACCSKPRSQVLFLNFPHVSAWRGLVLADAMPVFAPALANAHPLALPVPDVAQVRQALQSAGQVDAVYLTSPTYRGDVAAVREIAALVHERGWPLIVDEAHGAHFGLSPELPEHSVAAGADIVIHSVHKGLPGLTMTAWMHVNGPRVDVDEVGRSLRELHSTSPSYLLLASLDAAQAWRRQEGAQRAAAAMLAAARLRAAVADRMPGSANGGVGGAGGGVGGANGGAGGAETATARQTDPLRLWTPTVNPVESERLRTALAEQGMAVEYVDGDGVLCILGLAIGMREALQIGEIWNAWRDTYAGPDANWSSLFGRRRGRSAVFAASPRSARFRPSTTAPLLQCAGRTAAAAVTPYPPGVPLVWPGERIEDDQIAWLQALQASGATVHGLTAAGEVAVLR